MIVLGLMIVGLVTVIATILGLIVAALGCGLPTGSFPCQPVSFNPSNPAASGYVLVQNDNFVADGLSKIDMSNTLAPGFHWYLRTFFGGAVSPTSWFTAASDGLIINPTGNWAGDMATAAPDSSSRQWVGSVFSNGAYYEVVMAFSGPGVNTTNGWPAFWSMALEHMDSAIKSPAPGKPVGYELFSEDDFFEYDNIGGNPNTWGSALHTWYQYNNNSLHNPSCNQGYRAGAGGYCDILNFSGSKPSGEGSLYNNAAMGLPGLTSITWNVTTFHTLGHLWVPGTAANGWKGYIQTYFDGVAAVGGPDTTNGGQYHPLGKVGWTSPTPPATIDADTMQNTETAFAVHDSHRFVVLIGSGINEPLHIRSINIWQIPGCGNIAH